MVRVGHALPFASAGLGEARCSLLARELLLTLPGLAQTVLPTFIHKGACIAFAQDNCGALLIWKLQSQHESSRGPLSSLHLDWPQAAFQHTRTLSMAALGSISVLCCA